MGKYRTKLINMKRDDSKLALTANVLQAFKPCCQSEHKLQFIVILF